MNAKEQRKMSDEQLVIKYLQGENNSLGILYNRYYNKVYNKSYSFTRNRDDAFDIAQDVLMKAFSNIESFKGSSKFSTWLFSITKNHCISRLSRSTHECSLDSISTYKLHEPEFDDEGFEARNIREGMELKLDEFLNKLPEKDRKILELKYLNDYSVNDLQGEFKLSASAVKMRLLRARQKLGQLINDKNVALT